MAKSCITQDYQSLLIGMIDQATSAEILGAVVKGMPICEAEVAAAVVAVKPPKERPKPWADPATGELIKPVYINAQGKKTEYTSISAAARDITGEFSGTVCDPEGKKCEAASAVEILQIKGYVVRDDGDQPVKGVSKKLTIYHPKSPQLKKLTSAGTE